MAKRKSGRDIHGILLLDKRLGVSSNRALQEVKHLFNANKAGHTGSLDPLASGLLPICFGEATKVSGFMLNDDKRYQVVVRLGVVTDTGDAEGQVLKTRPVPSLSDDKILTCLESFTGDIEQVPPMYSALKLNGKKLYELARQGKSVERKARPITIYKIKLLDRQEALLTLDVWCSKGTYIRTLAEDIGEQLGCGGTVIELRRLASGRFVIDDAKSIEQLQAMSESELMNRLIPVDKPIDSIPAVDLSEEQANAIKQGQSLTLKNSLEGPVRMYMGRQFLGLGEMFLDGKLAPKKLFNMSSS
ncbi:MAG TPA: tRNA pseudouridine(55) synthase TruB [Methylococcaceae bacterium]|nr:tRNA pseudouridine(55) synthase TruB [Methylococcaceae bacterium]